MNDTIVGHMYQTDTNMALVSHSEVLMGEGNGVASVIMLTFTKRPGPHADFYKEARPHADTAWAVVG